MLRLKELRKAQGFKQKDVAAYLGISQSAYANYERGFREPDNNTLIKLSDYFKVSIDYLLGHSEYMDIPAIDFDAYVNPDLPTSELFEQYLIIGYKALDEADKHNLLGFLFRMLTNDKYRNLDIIVTKEKRNKKE